MFWAYGTVACPTIQPNQATSLLLLAGLLLLFVHVANLSAYLMSATGFCTAPPAAKVAVRSMSKLCASHQRGDVQ